MKRRAARWSGAAAFSVLVVGIIAALVVAYAASPGAALWLANASWIGAGLVAVGGVASAARRAARRDRTGWRLLLAGCVAWLAGTLLWAGYSATAYPASPNLADVCWLAFAVICADALRHFSRSARRVTWVSSLELGLLIVAACALLTSLWWHDLSLSPLAAGGVAIALAYPVLYVSVALVMLQMVATGALKVRRNAGLVLVLAGVVVEAAAFTLWCPHLLNGTYVAGTSAVDALWSVGMLLVGLGAWIARETPQTAPEDLDPHGRGGLLPALTFVILVAFQVDSVNDSSLTGGQVALTVGLGLVGMTLLLRGELLRRDQNGLHARLRERERELEEANRRLSVESRRDALTGLANRLRLDEHFADLDARAQRYGQGYCLVLCDLDRFKNYNDAVGHQGGDRVLRQVAALLEGHAREGDHVYRYGGEELLLVLPDQDVAAGAAVAERHRRNVYGAGIRHPDNQPETVVTFSAGVAAAQPGETPAQVLLRADRALYEAKASGRNQIVTARAAATQPA